MSIQSAKQSIKNYVLTLSLKNEMQNQVNKIFNEIAMLTMIYQNEEHLRGLIDQQMKAIQAKISESGKSGGWASKFIWGNTTGVSVLKIDSTWTKLNESGLVKKYEYLVRDMVKLNKQKNKGEQKK